MNILNKYHTSWYTDHSQHCMSSGDQFPCNQYESWYLEGFQLFFLKQLSNKYFCKRSENALKIFIKQVGNVSGHVTMTQPALSWENKMDRIRHRAGGGAAEDGWPTTWSWGFRHTCFLANIVIKRVGKRSRSFDDDTTFTRSTKMKDWSHHRACFLPNIFINRVGKHLWPFDDDTTCTQSTKKKDRIHAAARGGDGRMTYQL